MHLSNQQLYSLGFAYIGQGVQISDKVQFYGVENISIGDNVRIDDFTILSAGTGYIELGDHIHIASHCNLIGSGGIKMKDFSGLSSHCSLYSASDNYDGSCLIGPIMDKDLLDIKSGEVVLEKYATCGAHSTVLPNAGLQEGAILGAYSLATTRLESWKISVGTPAKAVKDRKKDLVKKAREMEKRWQQRSQK